MELTFKALTLHDNILFTDMVRSADPAKGQLEDVRFCCVYIFYIFNTDRVAGCKQRVILAKKVKISYNHPSYSHLTTDI